MTTTLVKKLTAGVVLAVAIVGGSGSALAQKEVARNQAMSFDPPGAGTAVGQGTWAEQGLDSGTIVGYYIDAVAGGTAHGFVRSVDGQYTIIDVPGAAGTQAYGINDKGTVVGWWFENPGTDGTAYHGYLRDKTGNFTYFDPPNIGLYVPQAPSPVVSIQLPLSINRDGTVAGSYVDKHGLNHGFVRSVDGDITVFDPKNSVSTIGDTNGLNREGATTGGYTTADGVIHAYLTLQSDPQGAITSFDAPGAGNGVNQGTYFNMINDAGLMPGVVIDKNSVQHGFLLSRDGTLVKVNVDRAGTGPYQGTLTSAVSEAGIAGGNYFDGSGVSHGFVRSRHGTITYFDVPGEGTGVGQGLTAVNSINKGGEVVGWYIDGNGAQHGYIYQYRGEEDSSVPEADHAGDRLSTSNSVSEQPTVSLSRTSLLWIYDFMCNPHPPFPETVTLTNDGPGVLDISRIAITDHGGYSNFSQTHTCGSTLGVGDSCSITVTWHPVLGQMASGSLLITDNGVGSPQRVSLTGEYFCTK